MLTLKTSSAVMDGVTNAGIITFQYRQTVEPMRLYSANCFVDKPISKEDMGRLQFLVDLQIGHADLTEQEFQDGINTAVKEWVRVTNRHCWMIDVPMAGKVDVIVRDESQKG